MSCSVTSMGHWGDLQILGLACLFPGQVVSGPQPRGICKGTLRMGKSRARVSCVRQPCKKE